MSILKVENIRKSLDSYVIERDRSLVQQLNTFNKIYQAKENEHA